MNVTVCTLSPIAVFHKKVLQNLPFNWLYRTADDELFIFLELECVWEREHMFWVMICIPSAEHFFTNWIYCICWFAVGDCLRLALFLIFNMLISQRTEEISWWACFIYWSVQTSEEISAGKLYFLTTLFEAIIKFNVNITANLFKSYQKWGSWTIYCLIFI